MRKLIAAAALIALSAASALAQTEGGPTGTAHHDGVTSQQPQQRGNQMMSEEMMRDMSGIMTQMNDMMQKMTGAIRNHGPCQDDEHVENDE